MKKVFRVEAETTEYMERIMKWIEERADEEGFQIDSNYEVSDQNGVKVYITKNNDITE